MQAIITERVGFLVDEWNIHLGTYLDLIYVRYPPPPSFLNREIPFESDIDKNYADQRSFSSDLVLVHIPNLLLPPHVFPQNGHSSRMDPHLRP